MKMIVNNIKVSHPSKKVSNQNVYHSVLVDGFDGFYSVLPCSIDVYNATTRDMKVSEYVLSYFKGTSKDGKPYTMVSLDLTDSDREKLNK